MDRVCEHCDGVFVHAYGCPNAALRTASPPDRPDSAVEHPPHYSAGGVEAIDVIEALGHGHGFCVGNALKYLWRAGRKSPDALEDLKKARWYIHRAIEALERGK